MANEHNGTMREHMTSLSNYRPPNPDGSFPAPPPPHGIPVAGASPGYPQGVASVSGYLPAGPTQLAAPSQAPQFAPVEQPKMQQPTLPFTQQPPPPSNAGPFYQDPATGYLVDAATRQFLPGEHPAYVYPDSYRQYQVAPPAVEPQPQAPQMRYPVYSPHSGPNAPEQYADPAQIPPAIAAPVLQVEGVADAPKKRGRRTKAEIEAARIAAGGAPAMATPAAVGASLTAEELVFASAVQGVFANPQLSLNAVTVEQLVYVGNLARDAFHKAFGA